MSFSLCKGCTLGEEEDGRGRGKVKAVQQITRKANGNPRERKGGRGMERKLFSCRKRETEESDTAGSTFEDCLFSSCFNFFFL